MREPYRPLAGPEAWEECEEEAEWVQLRARPDQYETLDRTDRSGSLPLPARWWLECCTGVSSVVESLVNETRCRCPGYAAEQIAACCVEFWESPRARIERCVRAVAFGICDASRAHRLFQRNDDGL